MLLPHKGPAISFQSTHHNPGNSHEGQQALDLGIMLAGRPHLAPSQLVELFCVGWDQQLARRTDIFLLFLLLTRFFSSTKALRELCLLVDSTYHFFFKVRRLSIEHIDRLDSIVNHPKCAVKKT